MCAQYFAGYQQLRARVLIGSDDRQGTSSWSVLKDSIGKDFSRIKFPVMFNKPTSMLQRMVSALFFLFHFIVGQLDLTCFVLFLE